MNTTALQNISRKKAKIADVQIRSERSRRKWLAAEQEAVEDLENTLALMLDSKAFTLSQLIQETGYSNTKVKAMAERARRRNREFLRKGTN